MSDDLPKLSRDDLPWLFSRLLLPAESTPGTDAKTRAWTFEPRGEIKPKRPLEMEATVMEATVSGTTTLDSVPVTIELCVRARPILDKTAYTDEQYAAVRDHIHDAVTKQLNAVTAGMFGIPAHEAVKSEPFLLAYAQAEEARYNFRMRYFWPAFYANATKGAEQVTTKKPTRREKRRAKKRGK
jgi:hypothetical protein